MSFTDEEVNAEIVDVWKTVEEAAKWSLEDVRKEAVKRLEQKVRNKENLEKSRTFEGIVGHTDEKELLLEVANYWRYPTKFGTPKGLMFYGYPGCGKTALVNGLYHEIDENEILMMEMKPQHVTAYVGTTSLKVSEFFNEMRAEAKGRQVILVLDEAEQLMPNKAGGLNDIVGERVSAILREVDGYGTNMSDIVFLLTTNHPGKIEPAFLRSGRVGFKIQVFQPTPKERRELVDMYLGHIKGFTEEVKDILFNYTPMWTGADYVQFSGIIENYQKARMAKEAGYVLTAEDISKKAEFVVKHTKKNFKKFEEEYEKYQEEEMCV